MSNMSWVSLINAGQNNQLNAGTALANSTSLTDITAGGLTAGQAFTIPASFLQVGQQWRFRANGIFSTTGTPTLLLGLYYGGVAGTALATTGAVTTSSGVTNGVWRLDADLRVESTGTSGSVRTLGSVSGLASSPSLMPATSSNGGLVTVDTSTAKVLTVGSQWGTASASNTVTLYQFLLELLD